MKTIKYLLGMMTKTLLLIVLLISITIALNTHIIEIDPIPCAWSEHIERLPEKCGVIVSIMLPQQQRQWDGTRMYLSPSVTNSPSIDFVIYHWPELMVGELNDTGIVPNVFKPVMFIQRGMWAGH